MNVYKKYRKQLGITQEQASELLNLSIDSLKGYESGARIPHADIVARMCILYNDKRLAYEHLLNSSVGCIVLEEIVDRSLSCSTLNFINALSEIEELRQKIIRIACDDKISETEIEEWKIIVSQLKNLTAVAYELILRR